MRMNKTALLIALCATPLIAQAAPADPPPSEEALLRCAELAISSGRRGLSRYVWMSFRAGFGQSAGSVYSQSVAGASPSG